MAIAGPLLGIGLEDHSTGESKPRVKSLPLEIYVSIGWWILSFFGVRKRVDVVVVPSTYGRFGNQVVQLAHATSAARHWGAREVVSPGNETFFRTERFIRQGFAVDCSLKTVKGMERGDVREAIRSIFHVRLHVSGHFFHVDQIQPAIVSADQMTLSYKQLRLMGRLRPSTSSPHNHLVIHLRGEDTFVPSAHPDYGQPPVAFYEVILESEKWSHCTIVHLDHLNPVFQPLIELCARLNIPLTTQSGTVEEDVRFLLGAKTLVASRTTFVTSVAGLSSSLERIFMFGETDFFISLLRSDVELVRVFDVAGNYWGKVCSGNWTFSDENLSLMLSYPKANLSF